MCKVSVIVPVYNGSEYIKTCCDTLINQTLKDIQVVFVDDGSTDDSWTIMNECSNKYENVEVFHQENKGVSCARNYGIKMSRGEYIGFVDVDDVVDPDMFELLYNTAIDGKLDVLGMENIGQKNEVLIFDDKNKFLSLLFTQKIRMSACNKIFKKTAYTRIEFPEGIRINEDLMCVYWALSSANRIGTINVHKYHYLHREGSSSKTMIFGEKFFDAIEVADRIYNDCVEKYPDIIVAAEARKARSYLRITKLYYMFGSPKQYIDMIKEMREYLKSLKKKNMFKYFGKYDVVRYIMYLYTKPLFVFFEKKIDRV